MYIFFMSLGCDKNLVDSEEMLGALVSHGFEVTDDESQADVIVVNTCCFIHDAKEESIQAILEMADYKTKGNLKALIVTGCLAQRYKEEITKEIPEVDAVLGTNSQAALLDAVDEALKGKVSHVFTPLEGIPQMPGKRMITTGGFYEYLKIAEGCNKHCTYCIIPKIRGNYRSVPMETLIEQAKQLAEQGVRELTRKPTHPEQTPMVKEYRTSLQKELRKIPDHSSHLIRAGIVWIRVLYCYPEEIYSELIETIRDEKKICHYLDLPIQHASDKILKRMGRRTSKQQLIDMVSTLRREIPDIVLRTTLITGFPGETQEDHEELMEFVDQMEFDRLGVFTYSPEEDTPAATMEDQIPEEVKQDRQAELMELQQEISLERGESCVGKDYLVMIEGKVADENAYVGRTYADAPGIDGYMFINTGELLMWMFFSVIL